MSDKLRTTMHNGRTHVGGKPFSAKHNDRNFDVDHAANIDPERVQQDRFWHCYSKGWYSLNADHERPEGIMSFEEAEGRAYEELFMPAYKAQMEKHKERRQYGRVVSFDKWRDNKKRCPEESFMQVGELGNTIGSDILQAITDDYLGWLVKWRDEHGMPFDILDVAYHFDEGVPQVHMRRVWHFTDDDGLLQVGQEKALEAAGVPLPDPGKKPGRYNNRKMTFDQLAREKWIECCEQHGVVIEKEPLETGKKSRSKQRFLYERAKELDSRAVLLDSREKTLEERETALRRAENDLKRRISEHEENEKRFIEQVSTINLAIEGKKSGQVEFDYKSLTSFISKHSGLSTQEKVRFNRLMSDWETSVFESRKALFKGAEARTYMQRASNGQAQEKPLPKVSGPTRQTTDDFELS